MMRTNLAATLVFLAAAFFGDAINAEDVKVNGRQFTIPDGFVLELAAGLPVTERPIHADFDERGRLYIGESSGSNDKVAIQLEQKPHSILRLEDSDGDGVFDKRTEFAKGIMLPEGALWYDGSFYVGAPPQIWKITDTDDDGIADKREVWFDAKTLNGCANDLHGPYLGPDGWIYWCKGAFEKQTYEQPGRDELVTRAAHMFRRRPEGGPVEAVMTGGMDNPVEVAFSPGGERFFTTTFLHHPHDDKRDGVIHAIYGGVYGKNHGVLDGHPRTGELMPELINLGAAAPCGMTRIQSSVMGDGFKDSLLVTEFNKHKVSRHVLTRKGGSFETVEMPFVSSPELDFHPTDVLEDADGSVLIVDTGGWYKLCCPTSQLYKPDIPGAIYRLSRKDAPQITDPRGLAIDWSNAKPADLANLAIDARPAVKERAQRQLAKITDEPTQREAMRALSAFMRSPDVDQMVDVVWAYSRLNHELARAYNRRALKSESQVVRNAAAHVASVWRDPLAITMLHDMLASDDLADRRVAAEALGRIGSAESVDHLMKAARVKLDRATEHSLTYALLEIGDVAATRNAIAETHSPFQRIGLIALDQMKGGGVDAAAVIGLLDSPDADLVQTAWWLIQRHGEWAADMVTWFEQQLTQETNAVSSLEFADRLALFANNDNVQVLMTDALTKGGRSTKLVVLKTLRRRSDLTPSKPLLKELGKLLAAADAELVSEAVASSQVLAARLTPELLDQVASLGSDPKQTDLLRLQALSTAAVGKEKAKQGRLRLDATTLSYTCGLLSLDQSATLRALAVDVLNSVDLKPVDLTVIAQALPTTGPMELKRLFDAFDRFRDPTTGSILLAALDKSPAATTFDPGLLSERLAKFGPSVVESAKPMLDRITNENQEKLTRIEAILAKLKDADERRGQLVFHGTKTSCIDCHQMGYLGGRIGPTLSRIGNIRTERDLLESVLFPSASFVRSFEPVTIITQDGKVHNGLVTVETGTEIVLTIDAKKSVRIRQVDIEERLPGTVSIMPAGLEKQLSDQDLADLIHFMKVSK